MFLNKRKYALNVLAEVDLLACKRVDMPLPQNNHLVMSSPLFTNQAQYHRIVTRLIYLTIIRPDLWSFIHILSQFMQSPRQDHFDMAIRILRYVKGHPHQVLMLPVDSDLQVYTYCCSLSCRSVTLYFVASGSSCVSWKTKTQSTFSQYRPELSTTQWLMHAGSSVVASPSRHQAAIHITTNPVFEENLKHIDIDRHFVRDLLQYRMISMAHVGTKFQLGIRTLMLQLVGMYWICLGFKYLGN